MKEYLEQECYKGLKCFETSITSHFYTTWVKEVVCES